MYKKKKSRLPLIITVFLIIVAAGAGMYIYQLKAKEASTDNSKEEEIVLEENQRLEYAKIVSISGNEMTVTADSDKEQTWLIPVGTDVVTKLGTTTTFSRLANGDNIRLLTQTDDEGNDVILKIWITDGTMSESQNREMPQPPEGKTGEMPQPPEGGPEKMQKQSGGE